MTELLQMFKMNTTSNHSHAGSQALDEVCHRLVIMYVFLWQLFPDGLQGDFQLASRLKLQLEFMVCFQHGGSDVIAQQVQIWRVWGSLIVLNEPRTVRLQSVLRDAWNAGKWDSLE